MTEDVRLPAVVLYNVDEARAQLRISRASLYRLVSEGKISHRKMKGLGLRFTPEDLQSFIDDAHRPAVA